MSASVVSIVGLPKSTTRVWGETVGMPIDMNPLCERKEAGLESLKSGEANLLFEFPQKQGPQMQSLCVR